MPLLLTENYTVKLLELVKNGEVDVAILFTDLVGFSNWALAFCRRRLNISWRRSRPSVANSTSVASLIFESEYFINIAPFNQ